MRVTQSMYYDNLYGTNNSKLNKQLFDVNKQIASGLKIQYASDDVGVFTETMRLDNELSTIGQVLKSTESGYKISDQTDVTLNQFTDTMNRMRTLVIQASNGTQSETSIDAIVGELEGVKENLKNLANTSINGQFLFSGSMIDTKPISESGVYQGNDVSRNALLGSNNQQQYNLTGADFFLGEEDSVKRNITSNVVNRDLLSNEPLSESSTIRSLMGDTDNTVDALNKHYFYLRGTASDGNTFKEKIAMNDGQKVSELLEAIGTAFGNTGNVNVVNVSMNDSGQIVVEDKLNGSSKLDFHLVGAVDYANPADPTTGRADVDDLDDLDGAVTDFSSATAADFFVKEFVRSNMTSSAGGGVAADVVTSLQGVVHDRTEFSVNGATLSSSVPQIEKGTNAFATASTKLSEVADIRNEVLPATIPKTYTNTLDGTSFKLAGLDVSGNAYNATIDLASFTGAGTGSTFTIGGTSYDIFNMKDPRTAVDADEVTYQQLMDVINMVVTDKLPSGASATDYDGAIYTSNNSANTSLSYDGKIEFKDLSSSSTKATMALYDSNSNDFTADANGVRTASVMAFNANDALTIRDPKTDFFKTIDDIIMAVESYNLHPDANSSDVRNVGMGNALAMVDDLMNHTNRVHAKVGAQSNALTNAMERTSLLEISTMTLRSSVIDTDLAESSMRLSQLTLNYQAMLSTVGKVSQLSLVNYL
ncbi:MAG: flagellin [Campylobacterota bacterium]|nr:flagellin [Campylobacterota bacterium]